MPSRSRYGREQGSGTLSALAFTLRGVARSRGWTTDRAVAPVAGIDPSHPDVGGELSAVLEAIDQAEDAAGRPLLSAVVVAGPTGLPSAGFFAYARRCGLHAGSDDQILWQRELQRVHDYWSRN